MDGSEAKRSDLTNNSTIRMLEQGNCRPGIGTLDWLNRRTADPEIFKFPNVAAKPWGKARVAAYPLTFGY